jgi:hypothetical protein
LSHEDRIKAHDGHDYYSALDTGDIDSMLSNLTDSNALVSFERVFQGIGADPSDDDQTHLNKILLVAMAAMVAAGGSHPEA